MQGATREFVILLRIRLALVAFDGGAPAGADPHREATRRGHGLLGRRGSSFTHPRMAARFLGREQDAADAKDRDDQRGADAPEVESAVGEWLCDQVSHRRAQWTREDERQPSPRRSRSRAKNRDLLQIGPSLMQRARYTIPGMALPKLSGRPNWPLMIL